MCPAGRPNGGGDVGAAPEISTADRAAWQTLYLVHGPCWKQNRPPAPRTLQPRVGVDVRGSQRDQRRPTDPWPRHTPIRSSCRCPGVRTLIDGDTAQFFVPGSGWCAVAIGQDSPHVFPPGHCGPRKPAPLAALCRPLSASRFATVRFTLHTPGTRIAGKKATRRARPDPQHAAGLQRSRPPRVRQVRPVAVGL